PYSELILFENLYGGHIKEGEEYLLFLRALNVYAYPENSYNIVGNGAYIIEDNTLYGTSKEADNWISDQNNTLDKMKDYLSKIPVAYTSNDNSIADSYDEVSAMYEVSDSVAKVKITSVFEENAIVDVIGIEIIENYKGSALSEEVKYLWPSEKNMAVEEEYFVFVDADGLPVAREGAIIGANDSNFNEAKEFLANK
ncbi:MAG: hypothetical protein IJO47_01560, partial [Clostridia bacterium]|nr:hypothetical protein [Clostridia bacterium]